MPNLLKIKGRKETMLHSLFFIVASMAIGYIVHKALYWHHNHTLVGFLDEILTAVDLLIVLAVVGFVLSLI